MFGTEPFGTRLHFAYHMAGEEPLKNETDS
jgi:hypothetical protein